MEFLNWAGEHYWLFFWILFFGGYACNGLGRIGSTTINNNHGDDE